MVNPAYERMVEDLKRVNQTPVDALKTVAQNLASETGVLSGTRLFEIVSGMVDDNKTVNAICATVYSLERDDIDRTLSDLKAYQVENPERFPDLTQESITDLGKRLSVILADYPALDRLRKAEWLQGRTGYLCDGVDILCDLRPVFDRPREKIEGLALIRTLRLGYTDQDGNDGVFEVGLTDRIFDLLVDKLEIAKKKSSLLKESCDKWLPGGWAGPELTGADDEKD